MRRFLAWLDRQSTWWLQHINLVLLIVPVGFLVLLGYLGLRYGLGPIDTNSNAKVAWSNTRMLLDRCQGYRCQRALKTSQ
jgi:hypothetical protein